MKTFHRGDVVISKTAKNINMEAEVDFETADGKVYISEWGRNLKYPSRLVLDKSMLIIKDKKIKLTRQQLKSLVLEFTNKNLDFCELKDIKDLEIGSKVLLDGYEYTYLKDCGSIGKIFGATGEIIDDYNHIKNQYLFTTDEIVDRMDGKEKLCKEIFGDGVKVEDLEITEDSDGSIIKL